MSKAEAGRTVDLVLGAIRAGVAKSKKEGRGALGGFGTFTITKRAARKGRHPQTGEEIRIKAGKVAAVSPGTGAAARRRDRLRRQRRA